MLRLLQEAEFDRYIGFAYELALDPARSGYPVYFDGMKTREDFVSRTRKSLERPGEDVLLFEVDGEVLMTLDDEPHQEIFALEFADGQRHGEAFRALLTAALGCLKTRGTNWLTFFVDEGAPEGEILKELGFRLVGTFVCHRASV